MIGKLIDRFRREIALAKFLRQPLPAPELPSWVLPRHKAGQKSWLHVIGIFFPEVLAIPDDGLPNNMMARIREWNTWFVNERSWDTAIVWLALFCCVLFLTTQSGMRHIVLGNPMLSGGITILGVVSFGGFMVYLLRATAYNKIKIALWDQAQP